MFSRIYSVEKKIYEVLGVRFFRILVFKLEKMIHCRDKGTNINYHISRYEPGALEDFVKYLFYNGAIHARNIAYFAIYICLRLIFGRGIRWYDILLFIHAVKDVYCVILQRYNYIRILERQCRLEQRRKEQLHSKAEKAKTLFVENYDQSHTAEDLEIIRSLKQRVKAGGFIVINENERKTLERMMAALQSKEQEYYDG